MKKGQTQHITKYLIVKLLFISIIFTSLLILTTNIVKADYACNDGTSSTECVCGHTPNSSIGYGQVIIGGATPTIISCNNILDGICPEDFTDTSQTPAVTASCTSCIDSDCTVAGLGNTGYVWGYVKSVSGKPLPGAIIKGQAIRWNPIANLEVDAISGNDGMYNSSNFLTGAYSFSASEDGYDTQVLTQTIVRGSITQIDFILQNGTCHNDCTNSQNRCNAACDGVQFENGTSNCSFYTNAFYGNTIKNLCNNKIKGTEVDVGPSVDNSSYFVNCCEGEPYLKYYTKAYISTNSNIKNLIKTEKIAKYNDVPVRIIVAYW